MHERRPSEVRCAGRTGPAGQYYVGGTNGGRRILSDQEDLGHVGGGNRFSSEESNGCLIHLVWCSVRT